MPDAILLAEGMKIIIFSENVCGRGRKGKKKERKCWNETSVYAETCRSGFKGTYLPPWCSVFKVRIIFHDPLVDFSNLFLEGEKKGEREHKYNTIFTNDDTMPNSAVNVLSKGTRALD